MEHFHIEHPFTFVIVIACCATFLWKMHHGSEALKKALAAATGGAPSDPLVIAQPATRTVTTARAPAPAATVTTSSTSASVDWGKWIGIAAITLILLFGLVLFVQSSFFEAFGPFGHKSHRVEAVTVSTTTATAPVAEQSAAGIQAAVDEIMGTTHSIDAPLADGNADSDPWSPWIEVPKVGTHGFDAIVGQPGPVSGKIRLQCANGATAEEADRSAHENFPCKEHNWFRINTVRTDTQTEGFKDVPYRFTVKRG